MAELFAVEAASLTANVNFSATATLVLSTNPLNPPYATAKVVISATITATTGTTQNALVMQIYRNPSGENALIGAVTANFIATAAAAGVYSMAAVDRITDGRSCAYGLVLTASSATANATANIGTLLRAEMLSG